jgi:uncharacterized membrane protein
MVDRFWEVDFARGIGISMMLVSNLVTDLQYFNHYAENAGFWWLFARITGIIFVFLVGLSLTISFARAKKQGKANFSKYLFRGGYIFALGLIISGVTWFFLGSDYIRFGVLHLIGLSVILAYPFLKLRKGVSLMFGMGIILIGLLLTTMTFSSGNLFWLGFIPEGFSSVDYFPLLPWFGVVLTGVFFGKLLYRGGRGIMKLPRISKKNPVCFLGRHSLLIYFIHQPIFVGALYLLGSVRI